jgi:hypothetical protein
VVAVTPSRRNFLFGVGGLVVLAACGDDSADGSATTTAGTDATGGTAPVNFGIAQRFPNSPLFTPGPVRLPISLIDSGTLAADGPAELPGRIESMDGEVVAEFTAMLRNEGISPPYYEIRVELDTPQPYTLRLEGDDGAGAAFQVVEPAQVVTPRTGEPLPPFDTPTVDDHRGVEPFCSLTPDPCPLHEVTLTDALASGKPVVYMVGTPAHCQTGTCAPGLEFLVAEHERLGDAVVMVHADVYADDAATTLAPAVNELGVDYEPIIYFTDENGVVVDRLDAVWDAGELRERLDLLLS